MSIDRKRYMLFGFLQYYPSGGSGDVEGVFDSIDEAKKSMDSTNEYHEILDLDTGEWIDCER